MQRLELGLPVHEGEEDAHAHRQHGEDPEGQGHERRRVVHVALGNAVRRRRRPPEGDEDYAEHIKGGEEGREEEHGEGAAEAAGHGGAQDLLLGEEAAEERNAGEGERAHDEHDGGLRHLPPQPAHLEDLVGGHRVDDGARAEEEEGLEDAVGQEVEESRGGEARADGRHHVAELGDGGIGQHALDVRLHAREHGGQERGEGAVPGHDLHDVGREPEEPHQAREQVDARRDHGGGVDEGRDGRGTFHGIGQPDVERELGRLACRAQIDAEGDDAEALERDQPRVRELEELEEIEGARLVPEEHDAHDHPRVARLGDPEGLDGGAGGLGPRVPVADEEIGAEPHQLPADEELDEVRREHQPHHREREERLVRVVPAERRQRFIGEIAQRIDLDEEGDEGDQDEHQRRVAVGEHAHHRERSGVGRDPGEQPLREPARGAHPPGGHGGHQRRRREDDRQIGGGVPVAAKGRHDGEHEKGDSGEEKRGQGEEGGIAHARGLIP